MRNVHSLFVHFPIALLFLPGLFVTSCDDDMMDTFTISPKDGASSVSRTTAVSLTFDKTTDSGMVSLNFHMMPSAMMDQMLDSVDMNMMMSHDQMMAMMGRNAMTGHFQWNSDYNECTFHPDSMLAAMTDYSIHMGKDMMQMAGMHHRGGMMGMPSLMQGAMMVRFTTGNAALATDHDSHH